jgi:hypothetical protein
MLKIFAVLLVLLFFAVSNSKAGVLDYAGKTSPDSVIASYTGKINPDSIQSYMQALEDFGARFCLAGNRREVAEWIRDKFIAFGYTGAHLDSFQFNRWYAGTWYLTWQYNVIAPYEGYQNPDSIFVLGAHHDAIVPYSSNPFIIAPGADDNASGVAATLEIARVMKHYGYQPAYTIKFITFAAEELGLHGSWNYANKAANAGKNIICMINLDMVSYCALPENEWKVRIQKYPNSDWFTNLAHQIIQNHTILTAVESTQYIQYSDSWPFYSNGYNAIFFIEDQFTPYYHTVNDLVATTNKHYAAEMTKISLGMLIYLNGTGSPPQLIPEYLVVQDSTITAGHQACFIATNQILVAGNGGSFVVNPEASAEFIAGESIVLFPGTLVEAGAHLHAWITTGSAYCTLPALKSSLPQISDRTNKVKRKSRMEPGFVVYPNPTHGIVRVEFEKNPLAPAFKTEIFNMMGEKIAMFKFTGDPPYLIDVSAKSSGIYLLRFSDGQNIYTIKLIKH